MNFVIVIKIAKTRKEVKFMIKEELEAKKRNTDNTINNYQKLKTDLQTKEVVKYYVETIANLEHEQKIQTFLSGLEVGEDGTVFSPITQQTDKSAQSTHFGLSKTLTFAIDCLRKGDATKFYVGRYFISFKQFQSYLENAKTILTDMNYVQGDRLFDNEYGYIIHENPKNYSVVDFEALLPLTDETFKTNYLLPYVSICNKNFFSIEKRILYLNSVLPQEDLTPREREAFYGKKAQQILGILPKAVKVKIKK